MPSCAAWSSASPTRPEAVGRYSVLTYRRIWLLVDEMNRCFRDYIQNLTIQAGNSGLILTTPSDPRTIGLTLRARQ